MRVWILVITVLVHFIGSTINAQEMVARRNDLTDPSPSDYHLSPGMSPEMWLYLQQQRRYDDPKQAVRRKAEYRALQRQKRLAALKWFGYSNLRPLASPTPFTDTYAPHWSGNSTHRYRWIGVGGPTMTAPSQQYELRQ